MIQHLKESIEAVIDEIIEIRRDFHAHPELSQEEKRTAAKICECLSDWGIPHQANVAGHGVVGLIEGSHPGSKGHTVAIRADIDALPITEMADIPFRSHNPGVMHACGHDIHAAVLLGAAKVLNERKDQIPGSIKLLFQPAEETVGGALPMIKAGCLENPRVDAVIGLHVEPDIPVGAVEFKRGSMNAASNEFIITVEGQSSHGARPQDGVDPILAAAHIVAALQSVSSRNASPTDSVVVTVGSFHAGGANNVIPTKAEITGIIRTLNCEMRAYTVDRVKEVAKHTALAFGAQVNIHMTESYPALVNDDEIEAILEETAGSIFPKEHIYFRPESSMGAEDFAYFCNAVKGAYFNIGTAGKEGGGQSLHNEYYCPDEGCIQVGILMETAGALAILEKLNQE